MVRMRMEIAQGLRLSRRAADVITGRVISMGWIICLPVEDYLPDLTVTQLC